MFKNFKNTNLLSTVKKLSIQDNFKKNKITLQRPLEISWSSLAKTQNQ